MFKDQRPRKDGKNSLNTFFCQRDGAWRQSLKHFSFLIKYLRQSRSVTLQPEPKGKKYCLIRYNRDELPLVDILDAVKRPNIRKILRRYPRDFWFYNSFCYSERERSDKRITRRFPCCVKLATSLKENYFGESHIESFNNFQTATNYRVAGRSILKRRCTKEEHKRVSIV